jgi:hypothetical protein
MLLEHLKKTTHSQSTVFLAVLVLIGTIAVYNWTVAPHRNYLLAAQRYESAVSNLTKRNQTINNNIKIKKKTLNKLQERIEDNFEMFFNPAEAREFFSSIKAVTEKAGCAMYSLTFSSANPASGAGLRKTDSYIIAHGAQLSVLGGYGNIETLMNQLQTGSKRVRIDGVRITLDNKNPGYLKCDMNVTIYEIQRKDNLRHG